MINKNRMLILVCSHRRSGTHWLIDIIRHNFQDVNKKFITIHRLFENHKDYVSMDELQEIMKNEKGHLILKSHMTSEFTPFVGEKKRFIEKLIDNNTKIIYLYRDGRDVMISLYFYMKGYTEDLPEFSEFLLMKNDFDKTYNDLNRIEYWKKHVSGWINQKDPRILNLSYEQLHSNFSGCMDELISFLGLQINKKIEKISFYNRKNVFARLKRKLLQREVKTSAILPRKGIVGDWKNYFSEADIRIFKEITGDLMERLGYH